MVRILILCITLLGLAFSPFKTAGAVEATGEGVTRAHALKAALQNAIDKSLGTQIEQTTLVENFQVIRQHLVSHSKGYVKRYTILNETKTDSGSIRLTLEAEVDDTALSDSQSALAILMQMAAHPRVLVRATQEDFDALSPIQVDFTPLETAIEDIFANDFGFVIQESSPIRSTRRPDILKQAHRLDVDYVIFLEIIPSGAALYQLQLDALALKTDRRMGRQSLTLDMQAWTRAVRHAPDSIVTQARDHIHPPASRIAQDMITRLQNIALNDGQEYRLRFSGFDDKTLKFLPEDLATLGGYVRHDVGVKEKKRLGLSYWSALDSNSLHGEITGLLTHLKAPHRAQLSGQTLTFIYDDPVFE